MKRRIGPKGFYFAILFFAFLFSFTQTKAQYLLNSDSAYKAGSPNSGRIWGYVFSDFYYKGHADSLNRGGANQYTGIPTGRNAFQFRRIYLGYDYNISNKFSTELLLAAEDNFPAFNPPSSAAASGDELSNSKETFFIKLANIRWKNVWKGTDLVIGEQTTPSFAMLTEKVWNYRPIERTIADVRRTPSYDMGAGLQGVFDPATKNFGYNLLVATGNSDKPASNSFKWFYGDVYYWFLNKKLVIDLYADYQRLNWSSSWHHDRQMLKGFIAYNTQALTIGVEGYVNTIRNDTRAYLGGGGGSDTLNTAARGISFYVHGDIVPNKLRFFARVDTYNPNKNIGSDSAYAALSSPSGYGSGSYKATYNNTGAVASVTSLGDISSKETFFTAGLDFTPYKDVHFMPNIWYTHYKSQLATVPGMSSGNSDANSDIVYRLTFFFVFGKHYRNSYNQF
ncbi:MAG TPA: hypothetical protein VHZ50_06055 [Puia sp.]|nr:hypothetical protein [Puia sp.]